MSLPMYVINFDELSGRLDFITEPTLYETFKDLSGVYNCEGFIVDTNTSDGNNKKILEWTADKETILLSFSYIQDKYNELDNWELKLNGETLFHSNYSALLGDRKSWQVIHSIKVGDTIEVFRNKHSDSLETVRIWMDLEYIDSLDNTDDLIPNQNIKDL